MTGRASFPDRLRGLAPLLLILALGLGFRLLRLGQREMWLDEACIAWFARMPDLGTMMSALSQENNPPLYYLLMFGWYRLFGESELLFRLPSLIAGLATIFMTWRVALKVGLGPWSAALAGLLMAASPLAVFYSVEARSYILLWLLGLALVDQLLDAAEDRTGRAFVLAGLLQLAALYTHYYALFLLPLWVPAILVSARPRFGVLAVLATGLGFAPWAFLFMMGHTQTGGTDWMQLYWAGPLAAGADTLRVFALDPNMPPYLGELGRISASTPLRILTMLWFGLPVIVGVPRISRTAGRTVAALLVTGVLAPIVLPILASMGRSIYLPARYELLAYPPWIILWAAGLEALGRLVARQLSHRFVPTLSHGLAALLTLGLLTLSTGAYLVQEQTPWHCREVAVRVAETGPATPVLVFGLLRAPLEHQLRLLDDQRPLLSFPGEMVMHPGWFTPSAHKPETLEREAAILGGIVSDLGDRVVLVARITPRGVLENQEMLLPLWSSLVRQGFVPGPPENRGRNALVVFSRQAP